VDDVLAEFLADHGGVLVAAQVLAGDVDRPPDQLRAALEDAERGAADVLGRDPGEHERT
jgi:hypothetical protein